MARSTENDQNTRQQLLEAAGQVFGEKGYDRATGKEICERAGANTAAVNYYFQSMEGLYQAAFMEAHNSLISMDQLVSSMAIKPDAKTKLQGFIGLFVTNITMPTQSSWMLKVIGREVLYPTPIIGKIRETHIVPKLRMVKAVVAELMGLPEDHPAVGRGFISVVAPCTTMLLFDRELLLLTFPKLNLGPDDAEALARHLYQFATAGLAAVAAEAKKQDA